jgi:DNA-binding XRE family transcriptional regulator
MPRNPKVVVETQKAIGDRLKDCRAAAQMTQRRVAEVSGLHKSTIKDWENGRSVSLWAVITMGRVLWPDRV